MARTLLLLRHAKASRDPAHREDHERPLEPRGERAAAVMGIYLAQQGWEPSLVRCSTARRTRETLERVLPHLPERLRVEMDRELYLASPGRLLGAVNELDDAADCVLFVGHNPGIEDLAEGLVGGGDREARERMGEKFPTGALAVVAFDGSWRDVTPGSGRLVDFAAPKELV